MKRLILLVLFVVTTARAQQPSATTITLGLFTTRATHSVTITPLGANAWQQVCDGCKRIPLRAAIHLDHVNQSMQFGGNLSLKPDGDAAAIEAAGRYTISSQGDDLHITLQIPSERYVAAVLAAEAAPDEPEASLEALAIAARTFALANLHRHRTDGYNLCDSTHCQALRLGRIRPAIDQAVRTTAGISLWSGTHRASIYYTQHCGGISEAASALWPSEHAPYLHSHTDPYCLRRLPAAWQADVSLTDLEQIAAEQRWNLPTPITGIRIVQHTASGRARLLEVSGPARTATISASSLHFGINRALGWNRIRSDLYTVALDGDKLHFIGRGYGHGVGLCQAGAFEMALEHHIATQILAFYFPKTRLGLTPSGDVWHMENIGAVTLRSTTPDPNVDRAVQLAWRRALELTPPTGQPPQPNIVIAPTTELFRQLTASPGYLLAVTRGDRITLQPLAVIRRNGSIEPLLVHELLHALIESQSTEKAPLWLREGLAEALVDNHSAETAPSSSIADIEQHLEGPQGLTEYRQAHRDAAAIVRMLGHNYSLTVVRQWLRDGVPGKALETFR